MDNRNPDLNIGDVINGFRVLRKEPVASLQLVFYELVHETIGSRLIHLSTDDDNCVFMVTLATHPENSTGVAHILEHGVLEGSQKYPVKIYKNLSGRSLNTFLNAMTSSDYTAYPFASRNRIDFFNLMEVYMDAVFFPLLNHNTFLQEGWRYEFAQHTNPDSPLEYKGVVFNEMKGAMSNPMRLFYEYSRKVLFPDLTYAHASGGNPRHIPDLTYEEWKAFHARFYHPSNAFFYTYGNIPLKDITAHIHDKVLSKVTPSRPAQAIPRQKPYESPQRIRFTYPMSRTENPARKTFVALLWKLLPITDVYENLKLSLLETILAGSTAAVLNRTLLESGLGGGLVPGGLQTDFSESAFITGLKDTDEDQADAIESLVLKTLETVCRDGFDSREVDAAIHELEFSSREIKGDHGIPFGLSLAFRGMKVYLEGGDFAVPLKINDVLDRLRSEAVQDGFFASLIRKYLLENHHRVTMILAPEVGGMEALEIERRKTLDGVRESMSDEDIEANVQQAVALKAHQNDEGDTSCLPQMRIEDISPLPDRIPQKKVTAGGIDVFQHDITTNGISYM
nr:insulinase family protein [bacterium]